MTIQCNKYNQIDTIKTIKPGPRVQVITPNQTKAGTFPYTKGYARDRDGLPSQKLPQQPGTVDGGATATAIPIVPTQGYSDPGGQ